MDKICYKHIQYKIYHKHIQLSIDCGAEVSQVSQKPSVDSARCCAMNSFVPSPKEVLWLCGLPLEIHIVNLPWWLRPVGRGLEGGEIVSIQTWTLAYIQPCMHQKWYCTIGIAMFILAILGQCWKVQRGNGSRQSMWWIAQYGCVRLCFLHCASTGIFPGSC